MGPSRVFAGAVAGLLATAAQTALSRAVAPRLPPAMRPPAFVPEEIVRWLEARWKGEPRSRIRARPGAALLLHLGYGSLLGALYARSPLCRGRPAPAAGLLFGIGAWAAGFQGWVPALEILPRTTQRRPAQWVAPVLGHGFYGVVTALALRSLTRSRSARG